MTKTTQEMFTEIVKRMVEGGWKPISYYTDTPQIDLVTKENEVVIKYEYNHQCNGDPNMGETFVKKSFPDLLLNAKAMGAVFGDKKMCPLSHVDLRCPSGVTSCRLCYLRISKRIYISMQATRIAHEKGIEEAIEYVYKEMEK